MTKTNSKGLLLTPGFLSRFCALMLFIICSVVLVTIGIYIIHPGH